MDLATHQQPCATHKRLKDALCCVSAWVYLSGHEVILGKGKCHVQKTSPALLLLISQNIVGFSFPNLLKLSSKDQNYSAKKNTKCIISKV